MKTRIIVENVRVHVAERGVYNQPNLSDVEFVFNGEVVDIDPEEIKEWEFTGMNNIDFIMAHDWENGQSALQPFDDGPFNGLAPNNLEEAVNMILPQLTPANIQDIKHIKDEEYEVPHGRQQNFDMYICLNGMNIRNEWNLWGKSNLSQWFADHGIYHADDMSGTICKAVWCNINNVPFDIEEEAEHFKGWWEQPAHGGIEKQKEEYYNRCKSEK